MLDWGANLSGRNEAGGAVTANSESTDLTTSATASTKGTWVSLGITPASTWGTLGIVLTPFGNEPTDFLVDVAQGDGTNFSILVPDLHVPTSSGFLYSSGISPLLPLSVQQGVAIYARAASAPGSDNINISVRGGPGLWGAPGFSRAVALFTPGTSRGVAIDPGATANTPGSWTQMTTGVSQRIGAVLLVLGTAGVTTRAATMSWLVDIGIGASGSQQTLVSGLPASVATATAALWPAMFGPFACDIPASTAWWVRAQCSANTASTRTFDASLYGLVV